MQSLVIRSEPSVAGAFRSGASVGLPARVETAGLVLPLQDEFRVWINRPQDGETLQFRVTPDKRVLDLQPLQIVAAGTARCGEEFVISGADQGGFPIALGTDLQGKPLWRQALGGQPPFRWPLPACQQGAIIVWQTTQTQVDVADIAAGGLTLRTPFPVGGPPFDLAVSHDAVWAIWSDASGISALEATDSGQRRFHLSNEYASQIAIAADAQRVCVAWEQGNSGFLTDKPHGSSTFATPLEFELGEAAGGDLRIIFGKDPLVFVRRGIVEEGSPARMVSVLTAPRLRPTTIEGRVHSVASQGDTVALLGETKLQLLSRFS